MAVTAQTTPPALLTYEAYMAEPETMSRYEILDGVRVAMTSPTARHQWIQFHVMQILAEFETRSHRGRMIHAPRDILIRRDPLRTHQPDVLFISHQRLAQCPPPTDPAPLPVGPELVVEILSPTETQRTIAAKLDDYRSVEVQEVWIVDPEVRTVEVIRLTTTGPQMIDRVGEHGQVVSAVFPGLVARVSDLFRD